MSTPVHTDGPTSHEGAWAKPVKTFDVSEVPTGALNLNVQGRQLTSPLQGFGQMWQKTYRVRLPGVSLSPAEVMQVWRAEFPSFQPRDSRFYPSMTGIKPGGIILIDLKVAPGPGMPNLLPVSGGVMVLYVDDTSFTVMTPQGFVVSGWNTFSVLNEEEGLVVQIQSIDRATDPIYEIASLFFGAAQRQEENWIYVLNRVAERFGVQGKVELDRTCVDPRWQWSEARNVWQNGFIRTMLYKMTVPLRRVAAKDR